MILNESFALGAKTQVVQVLPEPPSVLSHISRPYPWLSLGALVMDGHIAGPFESLYVPSWPPV